MIVDDVDIIGMIVFEAKHDAKLVIDTNTHVPLQIALQLFEMIGRGNAQIVFILCCIEHVEFDLCPHRQLRRRFPTSVSPKNLLGFFTSKTLDHMDILSQHDMFVNG